MLVFLHDGPRSSRTSQRLGYLTSRSDICSRCSVAGRLPPALYGGRTDADNPAHVLTSDCRADRCCAIPAGYSSWTQLCCRRGRLFISTIASTCWLWSSTNVISSPTLPIPGPIPHQRITYFVTSCLKLAVGKSYETMQRMLRSLPLTDWCRPTEFYHYHAWEEDCFRCSYRFAIIII